MAAVCVAALKGAAGRLLPWRMLAALKRCLTTLHHPRCCPNLLSFSADPAARNVTLEVVGKPPEGGAAVPPLQQQLAGLFAGLKKDA